MRPSVGRTAPTSASRAGSTRLDPAEIRPLAGAGRGRQRLRQPPHHRRRSCGASRSAGGSAPPSARPPRPGGPATSPALCRWERRRRRPARAGARVGYPGGVGPADARPRTSRGWPSEVNALRHLPLPDVGVLVGGRGRPRRRRAVPPRGRDRRRGRRCGGRHRRSPRAGPRRRRRRRARAPCTRAASPSTVAVPSPTGRSSCPGGRASRRSASPPTVTAGRSTGAGRVVSAQATATSSPPVIRTRSS